MIASDTRLSLFGDDLQDLLNEMEASFWIELDQTDLVECLTIGQLFDRVMSKTGVPGEPRCLSSVAFYRLRKAVAEKHGLSPKSITPHTKLVPLFPLPTRRSDWQELQTTLRVVLPPLAPGNSLLFGSLLASVAIVSSFAIRIRNESFLDLITIAGAGALGTFIAWGLCLAASIPIHRAFPADITTVGDLAHAIVPRNFKKIATEAGGTTEQQAWRAFQMLVAEGSGLRSVDICREMRFPQDLKIY